MKKEERWTWVSIGFAACFLFMLWFVPRTRIIDTIPAQQECVKVTIFEQTESFCKPSQDLKR